MADIVDPILRRMAVVHGLGFASGVALWLLGFDGRQWVVNEMLAVPTLPEQLPLAVYQMGAASTIALAIFVYSWRLSRTSPEDHPSRRRKLFFIFLGSLWYLWAMIDGPLMLVNRVFDNSPPIARTAKIIKRRLYNAARSSTMHYLLLSSWRSDLNAIRFEIDKDTYNDKRFAVGRSIELTTRAGFLGYEYIEARPTVGSRPL